MKSKLSEDMKHLFQSWGGVENRIRKAEKVFIFLDYDGTLTPIMDNPEAAVLPEKARQILRALATHPRYKLAVISGRALDDVKKRVVVDNAYYAGNHGLEVTGPNLVWTHPEAEKQVPTIGSVLRELQREIGEIRGIILEDKRLTLSVHYRLVREEELKRVKKAVKLVAQRHNLAVATGKMVLNVKPMIQWDKGKAAEWLLKLAGGNVLPIYIGDDETDEDAFECLREGITVLVSERKKRSKAQYYLLNTGEVSELLDRLTRIDSA